MLRKILNNISNNFEQSAASITTMAVGASFWIDRHYFFWPPTWGNNLNDERLDIGVIIFGLGLLICSAINNKYKWLSSIFFILSAAVVLGIATSQLLHGWFTSEFRMMHTAIGDFLLFALILHSAYKS